jgi:hypothetical protein
MNTPEINIVMHVAALLTQSYVQRHKPMSPDRTLDVYEQFVEQLRVIEADQRSVGPKSRERH